MHHHTVYHHTDYPSTMDLESHFHVLLLGTGLTESITAAALAKAGFKVVHIDINSYYGASEASLTTEELKTWIEAFLKSSDSVSPLASVHGESPSSSRSYSLSLSPSVFASTGPFITSLIGSGVARYGGFRLLERTCVYSAAGFKSVPGSKEDIFKSKELSLVDKRKLMRFLTFASGDFECSSEIQGRESMSFLEFLEEVFSINKQLASALTYALAFCSTSSDTIIPALTRIKHYLRSAGRYGPSPFLVGQYGGLGELAQGFCRVCAVSGGTYILGHDILAFQEANAEGVTSHCLNLGGIPENLTSDIIIVSSDLLSKLKNEDGADLEGHSSEGSHIAHCIAIIDGTIASLLTQQAASEEGRTEETDSVDVDDGQARTVDSALLVYPPNVLSTGSAQSPVNAIINGEGTLSCPRGKSLLYLSTAMDKNTSDRQNSDAERLLRPYLDATLSLARTTDASTPKELFSAFYVKSSRTFSAPFLDSFKQRDILVCPSLPSHFAESGDAAAVYAEALFRETAKHLGRLDFESMDFWPPLPMDPDDEDIS
ncbi:FAD/NAD-binding domain-containing protein [Phellopilus nigrolimitatus]|nr:FAD/NAD-binding domain-containing protein [Phellopilus nigrolimitatus]